MTEFLGCKLVTDPREMAEVCAAVTRELNLFHDGRKAWGDGPKPVLRDADDYLKTIAYLANSIDKTHGPGFLRTSMGRVMVAGEANRQWKEVYFHIGSTDKWPQPTATD